jgi:hypothetical protein
MEHTSPPAEPLSYEGGEHCVEKDCRPNRRADLKSHLVEEEMLVLDRASGLVHQLNRTATYIWKQCSGQCTPTEIAAQLSDIFEVDEETAFSDVVTTLRQLQELRLLQG